MIADAYNRVWRPIQPAEHVPLEMVLLWSAVMITLQTQFNQNCWMEALVWTHYEAGLFIQRGIYHFSSQHGWSAADWCISAASLVPLPLVLVLLSMSEPPFFIPYCDLSFAKQTQISLHLSAATLLWKLMNCRDRLILFALLGTSVLRGKTLQPIYLKLNNYHHKTMWSVLK